MQSNLTPARPQSIFDIKPGCLLEFEDTPAKAYSIWAGLAGHVPFSVIVLDVYTPTVESVRIAAYFTWSGEVNDFFVILQSELRHIKIIART